MAKRRRSPEELERREKIYQAMQNANIGDMADLKSFFKDIISVFLEKGLEGELDESLGYSKYDYHNKKTDNSRNGYSENQLWQYRA